MDEPLHLVPQPQHSARRPGCFALSADTRICLPPAAGDDDLFAARQLQREIAEATGLTPRIERQWRPYRTHDTIVLLRAGRDAAIYPPAEFGWQAPAARLPEQAYQLTVGPHGAVVAADSSAGLFYGVQTLRQLVRVHGCALPQVAIEDAPALAERGVLLDVCRGKVPTLATLKELAEKLSFFKINQLQLHNEHAYSFPRHPEVGAGSARLTNEELLVLDAHCRRHHIELVPNLQSFGHMRHILSLPCYRHLAETELCWSLAPTVAEGYRLLDELYADLLPAFSSAQFNVNCDETWDLGQGCSEQRMEEVGPGRLYLEHILRVHELVTRYGRRMQMWGDIVLKYPELIADLPGDVTLLDWHYEAEESYPSIALLAGHGRRFLVCPGTSSWNTLFPRLDNANRNIRIMAREGATHGAAGLLNTDWGDYGHYQPLGQSWYGYAYGAEQAWTGGRTPDEAFEPAFGRLFFGLAQGEAVVAAMRRLAAVNLLPGIANHNGSYTVYALFDEPLTGRMIEELPAATLDAMREAGLAAEEAFALAAGDSREPLALREMAFSAQLMREAGEKVALSQRIRSGWARMATGEVASEAALHEMDVWLAALDTRWEALLKLRGRFTELWQARAHLQGNEEPLRYYRGTLARYDAAAHWLRVQRQAFERGRPIDAKLEAYGAVEQRILWEQPFV
ncbi:MAG TPA: glycoside hydrolase family 20 zincin-like fold domain-containing protein [Anaerolineae bacterium]|nr:glycoside hydrolase family 20 zincin-like fold domain-containing protein [Anaerolineae bacterium]HOR00477.1 glycoside hydrolase family 20 zincin-like fold domain-containing protein [Anaerolineae bacterium]